MPQNPGQRKAVAILGFFELFFFSALQCVLSVPRTSRFLLTQFLTHLSPSSIHLILLPLSPSSLWPTSLPPFPHLLCLKIPRDAEQCGAYGISFCVVEWAVVVVPRWVWRVASGEWLKLRCRLGMPELSGRGRPRTAPPTQSGQRSTAWHLMFARRLFTRNKPAAGHIMDLLRRARSSRLHAHVEPGSAHQ